MRTTEDPWSYGPEQLSAEAGITAALAANFLHDQNANQYSQSNTFNQTIQAAGRLVGEGSLGDAYLTDLQPPQEVEFLSDWSDLQAKDLGLRPRIDKDQVSEIKERVREAVRGMDKNFPSGKWASMMTNYDVFRKGSELIVADAGDYGVPIKKGAIYLEQELPDDAYMVTVGSEQLDSRRGMTRGVYKALLASRVQADAYLEDWDGYKHSPSLVEKFERGRNWEQYATAITGEQTPRNGRWVAFGDGTFEPHDPAELIQRAEIRDITQLCFRPAVVLPESLVGQLPLQK